MPIESIQCVKCGSPLEVESTAKAVTCGYCGSRLRITPGASGHLLGVLDDIKLDTEIIAKQTAVDHLSERLAFLLKAQSWLERLCWDSTAADLRFRILQLNPRARRLDPLLQELGDLEDSLYKERGRLEAEIRGMADAAVAEGMRNRPRMRNRASQQLYNAGWAEGVKQYGSAIACVEEQITQTRTRIGNRAAELHFLIEEEIESTQARIGELRADMDRLAREL